MVLSDLFADVTRTSMNGCKPSEPWLRTADVLCALADPQQCPLCRVTRPLGSEIRRSVSLTAIRGEVSLQRACNANPRKRRIRFPRSRM